ncbi:polysaccharide deacetylase family protein [Streptomyces sp. NPDC057137]|uniref:polysaccharide deacetylase family protein n=1 Tax=Streptomyces sp. NPDC057137 TaxID=3346030 RepID=UPI00363C0012
MQLVRQKDEKAAESRKRHPGGRARGIAAVLLIAALGSACAAETDDRGGGGHAGHGGHSGDGGGGGGGPVESASVKPGRAGPGPGTDAAKKADAAAAVKAQALRAVAAKKWKLAKTPLAAPAPPAVKPRITTRKGFEVTGGATLPPVFTTVPTKEKVVFLTIDDGAEKDPRLLRMMDELKIPYSAFLSDYVINDNYAYFKKMQARGVSLHNHTLTHPYLPGLSYEEQKREICGQQDKIKKQYGKRPELFRPPYGNYNAGTLRAAKSCGVKAVPLWSSEAFPDHMEWREWDRDLHPGDIVLTHFRGEEDWKGSMPDMIRHVMKTITDKGYAVAKLEDYV